MKVIRHDNKLVQPIFALASIVIDGSDEEFRGTRGLQETSLAPRRGRDKERALAGGDSGGTGVTARDGHATIFPDALAYCGDKHHPELVAARAEIETAAKAGMFVNPLRHA
jgi:hypothetical protein